MLGKQFPFQRKILLDHLASLVPLDWEISRDKHSFSGVGCRREGITGPFKINETDKEHSAKNIHSYRGVIRNADICI